MNFFTNKILAGLGLCLVALPASAETRVRNGFFQTTEKELCEHDYPSIDAALTPLGASFVPLAASAEVENGEYWWMCGGKFEWKTRPSSLIECNQQVAKISAAFDAAVKELPEEQRPNGIGGGTLQCWGHEAAPGQTLSGPELSDSEKISELVQTALDPKGYFGSWNMALIELHKYGELANYFDIDQLISNLKSADAGVHLDAVHVLGRIGRPAQRSTPELKKLIDSPNANMQRRVASAIGEVNAGDSSEVNYLRGLLNHREGLVGQSAISGLGAIGPAAFDAIPDLEAISADPTRHIYWKQLADDSLAKIKK